MSFFSRSRSSASLNANAAGDGSSADSPRGSRKPSPVPPASNDESVIAATKDMQYLDVGGSRSGSSSPEKERKSGFLGMRSRTASQASLKSNKSAKEGAGGAKGEATATTSATTSTGAGVSVNGAPAAGSSVGMREKAALNTAGAAVSSTSTNVDENAEELPPEMTGKKWRPRPGHPGNLSPSQTSALLQLTGLLSSDSALPPTSQFTPEELEIPLCRFLRARNWNVSQAREMWNKSVEWKKSVDLDRLMTEFDFSEREQVAKAGWQMYFHKVDKLGRPIFVQDLAGLDPAQLWVHTNPDRIVKNFAVTLEHAVRYRYKACSAATPDGRLIEDNLMILDIQGLGMSTFWNFKGQLQQLLSILDNNFPELSGRVQIINAPWLFSTIWGYLKGWLPPNTVDKIDITGADYSGVLLQFIDAEALPKRLGGKCECKGPGGCVRSDAGPWNTAGVDGRPAAAADKEKLTG